MAEATLSLPVSVLSSSTSTYARNRGKVITETFSGNYQTLLSNRTLRELGVIFQNSDGKSSSYIKKVDLAINLLCKFMVQNDISELGKFDFGDLGKLQYFINRESDHGYGKDLYNCLRTHKSNTPLSDLIWPKTIASGPKEGQTEGHTMYAYNAMGAALRKEIDRIREKKGRLIEDMKTGRVLQLTDLNLPIRQRFVRTIRPVFDFTKADVIRTISHYLPGWPVTNCLIFIGSWGIYDKLNGIRLGVFAKKEEADRQSEIYDGAAITVRITKDTMNPAELVLHSLNGGSIDRDLTTYSKRFFVTLLDVVDYYFTTVYDWQCVYLYWSWLTGWNNESIASITAGALNLGIDIGNKSSIVEMIAPHHIEIKGKEPTSNANGRQWRDAGERRERVATITGYKTRSQPDNQPKECVYICDTDNDYDLYKVLADFYELTTPLRVYLQGEERNCILVGVPSTHKDEKGRRLSMFGAPLNGEPPDYRAGGLGRFFEQNPIYDDEHERLDVVDEEADRGADDPAEFPSRYTRILKTTSMKMRNTFETALKKAGAPLFVRKAKLGHKSERTTNTSYGADRVEKGIRRRELRCLLNDIEQRVFQGQLQQYVSDDSMLRIGGKSKIVQIFSHLQSDIFLCENPKEPTWPGHEEYTNGHCTEFDECLFCKNCTITPDSLPALVRWRKDIKGMPKMVGPVGISDKIYLRLQAIDEVFDLCRHGGQEWREALEKAYEIEMNPTYTAPDFMYRRIMPREG